MGLTWSLFRKWVSENSKTLCLKRLTRLENLVGNLGGISFYHFLDRLQTTQCSTLHAIWGSRNFISERLLQDVIIMKILPFGAARMLGKYHSGM